MTRTARTVAVADAETDPFLAGRVPEPFLWGVYDGRQYWQFEQTAAFVEFIRSKEWILYAHNGGKFDWHFILPHLNAYDDVTIINGRIALCKVGDCELRDSYNILPVPLSAYKKDEIDYAIFEKAERSKSDNWRAICDYLRNDCIYLHELIADFIARFGLQLTQASAAMTQWKAIAGSVPQSSRQFYETLRPYYSGGRVQCFRSGVIETNFEVLDINSAYPFAMMHAHPYSLEYQSIDGFDKRADFLRVRCESRGAFPYRAEGDPDFDDGLHFPNDCEQREFCVTRWEYDAARETGTLKRAKVLESLVFSGHIDFGEYVSRFYQMRLHAQATGDIAGSLFAKLLMNSLYGKFAANPDNYYNHIIVPLDEIGGLEAAGWQFAGELGPWALGRAPLAEYQQRYYNVATGASITGFVRAMLWRAICASRGVLYCDTDSIAVECAGGSIKLAADLGAWKREGRFDRAGIAGKKVYIFRGVPGKGGVREYKCAAKGARITHAQLWALAAGKRVFWQSDSPTFSPLREPGFLTRELRFTA